jgi:hypothetical protein
MIRGGMKGVHSFSQTGDKYSQAAVVPSSDESISWLQRGVQDNKSAPCSMDIGLGWKILSLQPKPYPPVHGACMFSAMLGHLRRAQGTCGGRDAPH